MPTMPTMPKTSSKPRISSKPKSEYAIQTVTNALRMLEVFHGESEMGVSDLARRLGLHKNNAFRLLATLELSGYIQQSPETELYRLGPRCLELGQAFARSRSLLGHARPILEELSARLGETAHLGTLVDDEVVHLDGALPNQLVLTGSRVGERLPSHCTALGKVLHAAAIDASVARPESYAPDRGALRGGEGPRALRAYTTTTIVDPTKLIEELRGVQMNGYAVDMEEYAMGLCCVAAPVRNASSRVIAALSLSGPSFRLGQDAVHGTAATAIMAAASQLSQELGAPA